MESWYVKDGSVGQLVAWPAGPSRLKRIERTTVMDETKTNVDSVVRYQLLHSLLSIHVDSVRGRSLVRIPANSIVKRTMEFSPAPGFVEVLWQDRRYLVFDSDLDKQLRLSERPWKAGI
jgi:hypothetical protein